MAGRVVLMRFGNVEVLVETMPVADTEPTSALAKAADHVVGDSATGGGSMVRAAAKSLVGSSGRYLFKRPILRG